MSVNFLRKRAMVVLSDDEKWPASPSKRRSGMLFHQHLLVGKNTIAPPNFLDFVTLSQSSEKEEQEDAVGDAVDGEQKQDGKEPVAKATTCTRASTINALSPVISDASSTTEILTPPRTPTRRGTRQLAQAVDVENRATAAVAAAPPSTPKKVTRSSTSPSAHDSAFTGLATPKTPTRTFRKVDGGSQSTGLTPAMNKMMRPLKENLNVLPTAMTSTKTKKAVKETRDENAIEAENGRIVGYSTPKRLQRTKSVLGASDAALTNKPAKAALSLPSATATKTSTAAPSGTSSTLAYYQDAKTLFRRTTEPHRLVGRVAERETILAFCRDHILTPKAGSLYISGQPGTGKTALLKEVMRDMESEIKESSHEIMSVTLNCMTIKDPRLVYAKLLEGLNLVADSKDKDAAVKAMESLVMENNKGKKKVMYVVILDEIDQLLTKEQDVLYKLFEWSSMEGSRLTLFGIANALDMTDRFLPRLKARNCEPQLLNFNPYQVAEIRAIIMDRLFSLEDNDVGVKDKPSEDKERGKEVAAGKPRVAPLMQRPAIELCARKVAAATGDLRKALDICRQTIEMVELEAKRKERLEKQQQRGSSPLAEIRLANLENQMAGGVYSAERMAMSRRELSPAGSGVGAAVGLSTRLTGANGTTTLQDAPKVTVEHVKKALASAFGSPVVQKMKALNVHQKIVLFVLVMKIQSGKTMDCEVGKVFDHYTATCRSSNKIGAVNRGEYQDLINMLEANGLITLSKAKEERLKKIGLVPRESEVLDAIKGQDIMDTIVAKAGLKTMGDAIAEV
ncbi:AAA ATPase [Mortierella claussenii]|nr:AAA ATPase [Mortierella claussenii]